MDQRNKELCIVRRELSAWHGVWLGLLIASSVDCRRDTPQTPPRLGGIAVHDRDPNAPVGVYVRPDDTGEITANDFVEQQLKIRTAAMRTELTLEGDTFRGTLTEGGRTTFPLEARAGHCYRIIAAAGLGIEVLSLRLYDGSQPTEATLVDKDRDESGYPTLGREHPLCTPAGGIYTIEVEVEHGAGMFGLRIFSTR